MNDIELFIIISGSFAVACVLLDILVIKISDYWFDKKKGKENEMFNLCN